MNMLKSLTVFNMKLKSDRLKSVMNIFIPIGIAFLILIQFVTYEEKNEFGDLLNKSEYDDYIDLPKNLEENPDYKELNQITQALNDGNNQEEIIIS